MTNSVLNFEINNLPKSLRDEIGDFVNYLKTKHLKKETPIKREFGFKKGKVRLSDDFDMPLDDFKEYM